MFDSFQLQLSQMQIVQCCGAETDTRCVAHVCHEPQASAHAVTKDPS